MPVPLVRRVERTPQQPDPRPAARHGSLPPNLPVALHDVAERRELLDAHDRLGNETIIVAPDSLRTLMQWLISEPKMEFDMLADVTAVDYLQSPQRALPEGVAPERFEIVTVLRSLLDRAIIRIRVQVPEADPAIATLFDMYPGSEAMEREVYDMFGITFTDHPDLTRILMPEDWEGHPLRKDYEIGRIPVQFKGTPN
jgi:NADH-quinone oxidoreductase subunit C